MSADFCWNLVYGGGKRFDLVSEAMHYAISGSDGAYAVGDEKLLGR